MNHNDPTTSRNPECMTCSLETSVVDFLVTISVAETDELVEITSVVKTLSDKSVAEISVPE
jgi:hypothetical protein